MGGPKNPYFYDFGISGPVPGSQNQLSFLSFGETVLLQRPEASSPSGIVWHVVLSSATYLKTDMIRR